MVWGLVERALFAENCEDRIRRMSEPMISTVEWQPIDTAPRLEPIIVYGWNMQGPENQRYRFYFSTVAYLDYRGCVDLLQSGSGDLYLVENPTHWTAFPEAPGPSEGPPLIWL